MIRAGEPAVGGRLPCFLSGNTCIFSNGKTISFNKEELSRVMAIPTSFGRFVKDNRYKDLYETLEKEGILNTSKERQKLVVITKVTKGCNLACRYCYEWASPDKLHYSMSLQTFSNIVNRLAKDYTSVEFQFHGGEPFIYYDTFIKPVLARYGRKYEFSAQSNGLLFSSESFAEKVVTEWKKYTGRTFSVGISIDGLEKDNWMRTLPNGENSWHYVVRGIKNLVETGAYVGTITTVNKRSVNHLPKIAEFLSNLGVKTMRFNILYPAGHPLIEKIAPHPDEYVNGLIQLVKWRLKVAEEEPEKFILIKTLAEYMARFFQTSPSVCMYSPCGAGILFFSVEPDGTVFPCDHSPQELVLGNVNDDEFSLYGEKMTETLLKLHSISGLRSAKGPCASCEFKTICHNGGCPLFLLQMYGWDYWRFRYFCPKKLWRYLLKLLDEGDLCKITAIMEGRPRC